MANERTFLAWIRTTLALLAAAAAVEAVNLPMPDPVQRLLAAVLATTGLVCVAQAWRGWIRTETALRHRQPLPHSPANLPVVVGITVAALTLLAVLAVSVAS